MAFAMLYCWVFMSPPPRMTESSPLSPRQLALKRKLRDLRWEPGAIMREVTLIQKLRTLLGSK